jgi:hypothetical protein
VGRGFSHDIKPEISVSALAPEDPKRSNHIDFSATGRLRLDLRNDISTELDDIAGAAGACVLGVSGDADGVAG